MTYKINSVTTTDLLIVLNVDYTIGEEVINLDVNVFAPSTIDEITQSVVNRGQTEEQKISIRATISNILDLIPVNITTEA